MPKRGEQYVSMKRLAVIVKQAEARGRMNLVDELRERYSPDTLRDLELLAAYVRGMVTGGCRDAVIHKSVFTLDVVRALMIVLDEEVINAPGF